MRRMFFAGSFAPFTVGHKDIVMRGLTIADEIVIGIGINVAKHSQPTAEERAEHLRKIFSNIPSVSVVTYECTTAEAAIANGCNALLRSFRNGLEAELEMDLATVNREFGIETVLLSAKPELKHVSSTLVREYQAFGKVCKYEL